ncbi:MAG: hypothetical protein KGL39_49555 [Patescibacteria group bacterium]|nr:hypothetical protein [Patescibacteria group bacterium]
MSRMTARDIAQRQYAEILGETSPPREAVVDTYAKPKSEGSSAKCRWCHTGGEHVALTDDGLCKDCDGVRAG